MTSGGDAVIVLAHAADIVALGGVVLAWAALSWLRRRRERPKD